MALTLTQMTSHLGEYLTANRNTKRDASGVDSKEGTGLQRLGLITSLAGQTYTLYYNPSTDVIAYDTGTPNLGQQ